MSDVWPFHRNRREPPAVPVVEAAAALQSLARDLQIAADHLNRQHMRDTRSNGRPLPGATQ